MKSRISRIKLLLVSCLALFAVAFGTLALSVNSTNTHAAGTELTSSEYATDGSSIRIFRSADDTEASDKTGLRFHVEMGNGYSYKGTPIVNIAETNTSNGAFCLNEGFKTYTLILPTRLLNGELTVNTNNVMKLDTSNYWYFDKDGNLESVAYVYNIPNHRYTDMFSFRGIICDSNGNVIAQTPTSERCVAEIAKKSYVATNNGSENWGDDTRKTVALNVLKSFIPTYEVIYQNAGGETLSTENVMWGDAPQNAPVDNTFNAWYNTSASEVFNVNSSMSYSKSETIVVTATKSANFAITGVSDINDVVFNGKAYSGVKAYATLPQGEFPYNKEFDVHAVNVEYQGAGSFAGLEKVFVLQENHYDRLVFTFDSSNMVNGDKLVIKGDSAFYIDGKMYQLTEDYTIDYFNNAGVESYGVFLGHVYKSDIEEIRNYTEDRDGDASNGEESKTIRITFHEDIFVNSAFTFEHDSLPSEYVYPAYIKCPQTGNNNQIDGGYYFWNDGEHSILELYGYGNHNQDELFIAPGTKIVQNGGYYIFEDGLYAYYRGNGDGINQNNDEVWADGRELGTFDESLFELLGKNSSDSTEIRLYTLTRWFKNAYQLTVENMSSTEPYGIYHTSADGTITPITKAHYYGQSYGEGDIYNHQILAFSDVEGTEAGETLTIIKGTRLWVGNDFFSASDDVFAYYNGSKWIVGDNGASDSYVGTDDCAYDNWNIVEGGTYKTRIRFTTEEFNGQTTGSEDYPYLHVETGSVKVNGVAYTTLRYHGSGNRIFEIVGDSSRPLGYTPFEDTIVIEKGTRLWLNDYCLEFSEEIVLVYVGDTTLRDNGDNLFKFEWISAKNNVNITRSNITHIYNEATEPRIRLSAGILQNSYYGYLAVDTPNGAIVVNGVDKTNNTFSYSKDHNLIGFRGGDYGTLGSYLYIPAGTVLWNTQGSITFTESIYAVYTLRGWTWDYDITSQEQLSEIYGSNVERVYNENSNEIRLRVSKELTGYTYYGPIAIDGEAYLTKANGTVIDSIGGEWYGGNTGYQAQHSLLGFQGTGIGDLTIGDIFTIKAGTKIVFSNSYGLTGYNVIDKDLVYEFNGQDFVSSTGYDVKFNFNNATVTVDGNAVQNGEILTLLAGAHQIAVTPTSGYSVTSVSDGGLTQIVNNLNGTYNVSVNQPKTITISTIQSIKLGASAISRIAEYREGSLTGVRFHVVAGSFANIPNVHYGLAWNGAITTNIASGVYHSTTFGNGHNLFELRFDTANLKAGNTFKIAKGTVFYGGDNGGTPYAIEWTEDIVGLWSGSDWILNPIKIGEIDWSDINRIINYSDMDGTTAVNYGIRIYINNELFDKASGSLSTFATINGVTHTGGFYHHGSTHKIIQISNFNYTSGNNTFTIPAGTVICLGSNYYETTKTLTASCTSGDNHAQWEYTVS